MQKRKRSLIAAFIEISLTLFQTIIPSLAWTGLQALAHILTSFSTAHPLVSLEVKSPDVCISSESL